MTLNRFTSLQQMLLLSCLLLALSITSVAQTTQTAARPDRGLAAGASFSVSDIDRINLDNGNVNISIPLASLPPIAGGKLGFNISANYNSKLWDVVRTEEGLGGFGCPETFIKSTPQLSDIGGWRVGGSYSLLFHDAMEDVGYVRPGQQCDVTEWSKLQYRWQKLVFTTMDGATHELRPTDAYLPYDGSREYLHGYYKDTPDTIHAPMRYYSFDGSHLWAIVNPSGSATLWTVYLPDGTQISQTNNGIQRIRDTNGNNIKIFSDTQGTHYQDEQTGREIRSIYDPAGNSGQGQGHIFYQTVGGAWMSIDINYGTAHVQGKLYKKQVGYEGEVCNVDDELYAYIQVIREIVFPTAEPGVAPRRFTFSYDSDQTQTVTNSEVQWGCNQQPTSYTRVASVGMGELNQIVTPSGAIINYSFGLESVHSFTDTETIVRDTITQKSVTHDGITDTWHYAINFYGGSTVTNPDGSAETVSVYPHDVAFARQAAPGSDGKNGLTYRTNKSNLVVVEQHWQLMPFSGANTEATGAIGQLAQFNPVVDAEYTSLLNAQGTPVKMSARTFQYDYNGNLLQTTDYDWFDPSLVTRDSTGVPTGVPSAAIALRTVNNSYYNPATTATSANVYAKRSLSTATPLILNALKETTVGSSDARFSYDNQSWGTPPTVGNLTIESSLDNKGDADASNDVWINTSFTYGAYGNRATTTDALGHATQFFYDDATHALPNRVVIDPINGTGQQTTTMVYDYYTGLTTSVTDANGQTSSIDYTNQLLGTTDPFGRPGQVVGPAVTVNNVTQHQRLKTIYEDSLRRVSVAADMNNEGDGLLKNRVTKDQLGRVVFSEQTEDGVNYTISSSAVYEQMGRIVYTSSPMRSTVSDTDSWTRTTRDVLGRVTEEATFRGRTMPSSGPASSYSNWTGSVTFSYDANQTTVLDQQNKARQSLTDGLGRLIQVIEDPGAGHWNYQTGYLYDALSNLRQVQQGTQKRYFAYDSLSRLIRASNPEQNINPSLPALTDPLTQHHDWSLAYSYYANGNLLTRTDARNITTSFGYDALNRVTSKTYSDSTPAVNYYYDGAPLGKGRLWQTMTGGTRGSYLAVNGYDGAGRPLSERQEFYYYNFQTQSYAWSTDYTVQRGYNLAGHVTSQTYPSGRVVSYSYDAAGRTQNFTGNLGDSAQRNYATGITYGPLNVMMQEQFGTTTPVYNKHLYTSRGQLAEIRESTVGGDTSWNRGAIINHYSNHGWGAGSDGSNNNGNLQRQEVYVPNNDQVSSFISWYQAYSYDDLNRLTQVHEYTGDAQKDWQQAYSYDQWGNRTIDQANTFSQVNGPIIPHPQFAVNTSANQLGVPPGQSGAMEYDAAGNLYNDTYTSYGQRTFDAENRMTTAHDSWGGTSNYTYDGDGRRVRRAINNAEVWQIYGMDGELLSEYVANAAPASPQKEYGYRNGELLIVTAPSNVQNVSWANPVGVQTSGNNLTMTAASGWGNAGAASTQAISSGDGYIEFTTTESNLSRMCGLSHGDTNQAWQDIDYALYVAYDHTIEIFEGGVYRGDFGTYAAGDRFRVAVENGSVKYYKLSQGNSQLLYTSSAPPAYPLLVDTALAHTGATLTNVVLSGNLGSNGTDISWIVSDQLGTPRMILDQSGSLSAVKRHDYLPFGEELQAEAGKRTANQGYSQPDGLRQRYTGAERDDETGLDFMQARYYASQQGRFTSTDPLYLELRRLPDPQRFNLYVYARNNPLLITDPDGLEVTVKDKTADGTGDEEYKRIVNGRKGANFQIDINKKNKVIVVDAQGKALSKGALKALGKTLSGGEKELFNAITDTEHNATVNIVRNDPDIFYGAHERKGENTIDVGDANMLNSPSNAGGRTAYESVAHETLEAFYTVSKNISETAAHNLVNPIFSGLGLYQLPSGRLTTLNTVGFTSPDKKFVTGWAGDFDVPGIPGVSERISFEYVTPIPRQNFTNPTLKGVKITSVQSVPE